MAPATSMPVVRDGARTLYAGPYAGEFGWELCFWNPKVRRRAREFDRVVVAAPRESRHLYEFASEFVSVEPVGISSDFAMGLVANEPPIPDDSNLCVMRPDWSDVRNELQRFKAPFEEDSSKEWRNFSHPLSDIGFSVDVCCAFRPPKLINGTLYQFKAYPLDRCLEVGRLLIESGFRLACIGGRDNFYVPGTLDMRGEPLERQCALISSAKVTIGPSSGPLHLSQLCGTPVVTWYAGPRLESVVRYETHWNPFRVACSFLDGHLPAAQDVVRAARAYV